MMKGHTVNFQNMSAQIKYLTELRKEHEDCRIPMDYYKVKLSTLNMRNIERYNPRMYQRNVEKEKKAKENYRDRT